jgi:uncharacterized protein (DUF2062 family)
MRKKEGNRLQRFFKFLYLKLFRINDSPQRIALGFGAGAFMGIIPGTGPLAALAVAFVFRLNRAAALLGSILTNTWSSIVAFVFAIKIGSAMLSLDWQKVYQGWQVILRDFRMKNLLALSFVDFILPLLIGYLVIGFVLFCVSYLAVMVAMVLRRKKI